MLAPLSRLVCFFFSFLFRLALAHRVWRPFLSSLPLWMDGRGTNKVGTAFTCQLMGATPPPPHTHLVLSSCFDLPPPRLCCCSGSLLSTNRSLHAHVLLDIVYSYATHTLRKSEEREREAESWTHHGSWPFSLSFLPSQNRRHRLQL